MDSTPKLFTRSSSLAAQTLSMVLLILEVCHNEELAGTINPLISGKAIFSRRLRHCRWPRPMLCQAAEGSSNSAWTWLVRGLTLKTTELPYRGKAPRSTAQRVDETQSARQKLQRWISIAFLSDLRIERIANDGEAYGDHVNPELMLPSAFRNEPEEPRASS